jgi:hypothetical protein
MKVNPFKPNDVIGPGVFSGRLVELKALDKGLFQTKNQHPWHFLIHGERGIGKSSLLYITELTANGAVPTIVDRLKFNFLTISVSLNETDSHIDLITKIASVFLGNIEKRQKLKKLAISAVAFLSRFKVLGVEYKHNSAPTTPNAQLIDNLCDGFVEADKAFAGQIDGFLLLIDEADKAHDAHLGRFIKLFTEQLTKRGCNRVSIGIAGISDVCNLMKSSHESSLRILNLMRLEPLLHEERLNVLRLGIAAANTANVGRPTNIHPTAAQMIATLSEGYPHFIQQYAYSAFEADMDDNITVDDVNLGVYSENGALAQLGEKFFEDMYYGATDSDQYRQVLKIMAAEQSGEYVSRKHIRAVSMIPQSTLTNALDALSKRHIILKQNGKQGFYKLSSGSFRSWLQVKARTEQEQMTKTPVPPPPSIETNSGEPQ